MPGKRLLNVRVPEETAERFKEAAQLMKISLTRFLVEPAEKVADRVLSGNTELVGTTTTAPARVQPELAPGNCDPEGHGWCGRQEPAKPIPYGPDMPIGMMTRQQIGQFLAGVLADEAAEEERRQDRAYYSDY